MKIPFPVGCRLALIAALAWGCFLSPGIAPVAAAEAYQRFLEALKEQGYFDVALDYLESMRNSPLLSEAQKQELPFEIGRLLVDTARAENDATAKTKLLDDARTQFEQFIKANSSNPKVALAELELGNVLGERGRSLLAQSDRANDRKKDALLKQGRELLQEAKKVFDEAETKFSASSKEFPKFIDKNKEAERWQAREQVRTNLLRAQMFAAGVVQDMARSYPKDSPEFKKHLQEAADKYKAIYDKHRRLLVGLMARLKEGQCYQDLGDTKRAIGNYESLLSQGDNADIRPLKANALRYTLQCLTSDNEKNYEMARARGEEWLEKALPADTRTTDGLGVTYYTALASKLLSDSLTKPEDQQRKRTLLVGAKKQAQFVAKTATFSNTFRDDAQQLYRKLLGVEGEEQKEPTNFVEALDRAKELWDRQQDRRNQIKVAAEMRDEANVSKYESEARQFGEQAGQYFKKALELRDDETPLDNINLARFYLSYLDFQSGKYYDAAVVGEFVAKNYPKSQGGRNCAKIAMASYVQTYEAAAKVQADNQFDRRKMIEMADFITSAWPGGEEADDAWNLLLQIALAEGDQAKALEYLAKIPADSPRRAGAELKAGKALWSNYVRSMRLDEGERPPQAELDALLKSAQELLDSGLTKSRAAIDADGAAVTLDMTTAAHALAQIDLETGQAAKAIDLLNDAKVGPLKLIAADNPLTKTAVFRIDTYKLALRAYVATQALDKAEATMEALDSLVGAADDANAASQLTRIYVALGHELETQLKRLREENKAEEVDAVSKGFESFLDRVSTRANGNTFNSLSWVSQTFFSLGGGYDAGGAKEPQAEAKAYYQKSLDTDKKILEQASKEKGFAPEGADQMIKLRMARTYRRLRDFPKARDLLVDVLKEKSILIDAQTEAARNFQDWGAERPEFYTKAIAGDLTQKNKQGRPENLLWGWAMIARRTQSQKSLENVFYEACYNWAKCYMEVAKTENGAQRGKTLQKAEQNVLYTFRLRPQLGGAEWRKKFDTLLRGVQELQGKSPTGLPTEGGKAASPAKPISVQAKGNAK